MEATDDERIPNFSSPVLQQVYPALLQWKQRYGHPNIPLGSTEGKFCKTLRRLHTQNKLSPEDVDWLNQLGFAWHSLEDVYREGNFDELYHRLITYEATHPDHAQYQIPKKCPEDPELGAWVTGIRRLGRDGINPIHERKLDAIGFTWKSQRQCGSKFMEQYRSLSEQIDQVGLNKVLKDPKTIAFIQAQQEALRRGSLSQTRVHYMEQLFGESWTTIGKLHA